MIEVIDEILNGEPKYRIKDEDGNLLFDNLTIEMITALAQQGTPINRALFESIRGDLYSADRYNKVTVDKYNGIELPTEWTQVTAYTSYSTSDGYELTSSSTLNINYSPTKALDGSSSTIWRPASGTMEDWLKIKFPAAKAITAMRLNARWVGTPGNTIKIQGSNDDSAWTDLFTHQPGDSVDVFTNNTAFLYYRILFTKNVSSTSVYIYDLEIVDTLTLSLPLTSYETGKIVNIEGARYNDNGTYIDSLKNPYLNINNLGYKKINGSVIYSKNHSLKYNGSSWDIASREFVYGTYTGNGGNNEENGVEVLLGFRPKVVFVADDRGKVGSQGNNTYRVGLMCIDGIEEPTGIRIADTGFKMWGVSTSSNGPNFNVEGSIYQYFVMG